MNIDELAEDVCPCPFCGAAWVEIIGHMYGGAHGYPLLECFSGCVGMMIPSKSLHHDRDNLPDGDEG